MPTGSRPRDFAWVIQDRLAVASRVGGQGIQHRRVRREQEISWLLEAGFNTVVSLLPGNQNVRSYERAGIEVYLAPVDSEHEEGAVDFAFEILAKALAEPEGRVLVHRDFVDDTVGGILAGYVVFAGLVDDPRVAAMVIQEIIGRPLGPSARALIPAAGA